MKKIITILSILILSACSGPVLSQDPLFDSGSLKIIIASDLHYLDSSLIKEGQLLDDLLNKGDGKMFHRSEALLQTFVKNVIEQAPDLVLITGDLTLNGERISHDSLKTSLEAIEASGSRVFVIPGNHDINNPSARRYGENYANNVESVTVKDFRKIYSDFGYKGDESVQDPNSLSYLIRANQDQWIFMLDSNRNTQKGENVRDISGYIPDSTLEWMESLLDGYNGKVTLAMHHNLYKHAPMINKGFTLDNADKLKSFLNKHDINLVLSGHIHIQSLINNDIVEIASSALSVSPNQFGILELNKASFDYKTQYLDFSLNDNLNFTQESQAYFLQVARYKIMQRLASSNLDYSDKLKAADIFARLNHFYFSGKPVDRADDYRSEEGYSILKEEGLFIDYLDHILDNVEDSNSLSKHSE